MPILSLAGLCFLATALLCFWMNDSVARSKHRQEQLVSQQRTLDFVDSIERLPPPTPFEQTPEYDTFRLFDLQNRICKQTETAYNEESRRRARLFLERQSIYNQQLRLAGKSIPRYTLYKKLSAPILRRLNRQIKQSNERMDCLMAKWNRDIDELDKIHNSKKQGQPQ